MRTSGTKEWAEANCNFQKGCRNDCLYCYAKAMAIRFGTATAANWKEPVIAMPKSLPKGKTVMLPSSHDIDSQNIDAAIEVLGKLLERDNKVLIVTKPRLSTVSSLIRFLKSPACRKYDGRVTFRLTIGTANDKTLQLFEPGAGTFHERFMALRELYKAKIPTGVSAEPLLGGVSTFDDLYLRVSKFLSDQIWVGKMNQPRQRIHVNAPDFDENLIDWIIQKQTDEEMLRLYDKYKDDPRVAFKDSIRHLAREAR